MTSRRRELYGPWWERVGWRLTVLMWDDEADFVRLWVVVAAIIGLMVGSFWVLN